MELPSKSVFKIFGQLSGLDQRSTRSNCKAVADIGAQRLFRRVLRVVGGCYGEIRETRTNVSFGRNIRELMDGAGLFIPLLEHCSHYKGLHDTAYQSPKSQPRPLLRLRKTTRHSIQ